MYEKFRYAFLAIRKMFRVTQERPSIKITNLDKTLYATGLKITCKEGKFDATSTLCASHPP